MSMIPLRAGDTQHRQEADQRAERDDPVAQVGGQHPAHQRRGQSQEDERGQPPAAEGGLQQQEDADGGGDAEAEQPLLGGLPLGELAEQLGVVLEREVDRGQLRLDVADDRAEVATTHVGANVDIAREGLVQNLIRRWGDDHLGDVARAGSARRQGYR